MYCFILHSVCCQTCDFTVLEWLIHFHVLYIMGIHARLHCSNIAITLLIVVYVRTMWNRQETLKPLIRTLLSCLSAFIGLHFLECLFYDHTRVMNWSTHCTLYTDQVTCDMGFPWGGWSHSSVPRWHLSTATSTLVLAVHGNRKWLIFVWPARPSH